MLWRIVRALFLVVVGYVLVVVAIGIWAGTTFWILSWGAPVEVAVLVVPGLALGALIFARAYDAADKED